MTPGSSRAFIAMLDGQLVPGSCAGTPEDVVEMLVKLGIPSDAMNRMKVVAVNVTLDFDIPPRDVSGIVG